jgi:hypothetical protein
MYQTEPAVNRHPTGQFTIQSSTTDHYASAPSPSKPTQPTTSAEQLSWTPTRRVYTLTRQTLHTSSSLDRDDAATRPRRQQKGSDEKKTQYYTGQ